MEAKNDLRDMKINRVSYCGEGINKQARIALYKSADAPAEGDSAAAEGDESGAADGEVCKECDGAGCDKCAKTPAAEDLATDFSARSLDTSKGSEQPGGGNTMELTKAESDHVATLGETDKAAFLAKSATERQAILAKADEVITVDGASVRKSAVGPEVFDVLKAQQAAIAKAHDEIAKANERAEIAVLEKSAEAEYGKLPGTALEKAHLLRAAASLPEPVRKTFDGILKAAQATAEFAFQTHGTTGGMAKSADTGGFEAKVTEIQARDKCSKSVALGKARAEDPAAFEAYQAARDIPA